MRKWRFRAVLVHDQPATQRACVDRALETLAARGPSLGNSIETKWPQRIMYHCVGMIPV